MTMLVDKFDQGEHFEERLIECLLVDHNYAEQMLEVLEPDFFTLNYVQEICRALFNYYENWKTFPSINLLSTTIINEQIRNDLIRQQAQSYFAKIQREPLNGDLEFIKKHSLDFCRKQKLLQAIDRCLDLTEAKNYDQIVSEIQHAVQAGSERHIGHVYCDRFEERMAEARRKPVATPWAPVNSITGGGLSPGELAVILALTGVGKSHALVDAGAAAIKDGRTVAHYTFELGEIPVGKRYDSRISGIPFDDLGKNKAFVKECIDCLPGKVIIKKYPNRHATVTTIRNHIAKLKLHDVYPDVIIVDYADIMKSSKSYENKRFEEEAVYEELRSLADELQVPIWTASQTNRSGMDAEVLTLKHIAECFAKAMIADLFITMNRKKTGAAETLGNFFIAKNRLGTDGIKFNVIVNTALSRIECLEPGSAAEDKALLQHDLELESDSSRIKTKLVEILAKPPQLLEAVI